MKAHFLFLLGCFLVSGSALATTPSVTHSEIDKVITPYLKADQFSGVVLVQGPQGLIHLKSYGMAVREHSVPTNVDTVFRIGSVSKQFTAALILHLQERALLSVDDPLSRFFDIPKEWEGIKIHHLLTHTSGMAHDFSLSGAEFAAYHTPEELLANVMATPLLHREGPGKRYSYSNIGYTLLAIVVERVLLRSPINEKTYPEFFERTLTKGLSLTQSGVDHHSLVTPNMATGYIRAGSSISRECCVDILNLIGAGEVRSSALDLSKWLDVLLEDRFLNESSRKQIWAPNVQMEHNGKPLPGLFYGYGWVVTNKEGRLTVLHNGSVPGFDSDVAFWPNDHIRIIVLSNVRFVPDNESSPSTISSEIRQKIAALLFSAKPPR